MLFKYIPFSVEVPDFKKDVEAELEANQFFQSLSPKDKALYVNQTVAQRSMLWACKTAAAAYNIALVIFGLLILVQGSAVLQVIQNFIQK
jgi:hypothetical protein